MGLVPTFAAWGVAASVLMVILRLVQGFCLGGELPGALTYVVETAPRHAPFVCGVVFSCVTLGVAAATGISLGVRTWLPPEMVPWLGWRLAFVIGGLGGVFSFVLRRSLEESPEFARMKQIALRRPFGEVLRRHLGSGPARHRRARRDRRIQRPLFCAHGRLSHRRAALRSSPGHHVADDRGGRARAEYPGRRTPRRSGHSATPDSRRHDRLDGAGHSFL